MLGFVTLSLCALGCAFVGLLGLTLWSELFQQPLASANGKSRSTFAMTSGIPSGTGPSPSVPVRSRTSVVSKPVDNAAAADQVLDRIWGSEAARFDARSRRSA
ncbi:MAG: hypothetical protein NT013_29470 [Planctomycetia bacterium]|nr:hypothetical protein [Planctomycetia bacterium]